MPPTSTATDPTALDAIASQADDAIRSLESARLLLEAAHRALAAVPDGAVLRRGVMAHMAALAVDVAVWTERRDAAERALAAVTVAA